jgi:hypothetical protein
MMFLAATLKPAARPELCAQQLRAMPVGSKKQMLEPPIAEMLPAHALIRTHVVWMTLPNARVPRSLVIILTSGILRKMGILILTRQTVALSVQLVTDSQRAQPAES